MAVKQRGGTRQLHCHASLKAHDLSTSPSSGARYCLMVFLGLCGGERWVSHWPVDSEATVRLITGAIGRMSSDPSIDRAEALRQAMLTLIGAGFNTAAHPATWALFVVVGEGAVTK